MAGLLTLDLATRTGFAWGSPGDIAGVRSGSIKLKDPQDEARRAARNLGCWLRDEFSVEAPDLLVYEAAYSAAQMMHMGNASHTADSAWQLVGAVNAVAACYGVRTEEANLDDVRGHFTGRKRWGGRDEAKRKVVERCHLLGYFPNDCRDDNRGDACAVFDWASHHYFRKQMKLALSGSAA